MAKDKTKPVHEVRLGRIRAAIWENETQVGIRYNVNVARIYKDGEQWKMDRTRVFYCSTL